MSPRLYATFLNRLLLRALSFCQLYPFLCRLQTDNIKSQYIFIFQQEYLSNSVCSKSNRKHKPDIFHQMCTQHLREQHFFGKHKKIFCPPAIPVLLILSPSKNWYIKKSFVPRKVIVNILDHIHSSLLIKTATGQCRFEWVYFDWFIKANL